MMTLLIIDDSPGARQIYSHMLQTLGIESHAVASGPDALIELANANLLGKPYGLLIIDWKMPGMDGVELLAEIRRTFGSVNEPAIIMTTAYDYDELQAALGEESVGAIMRKPATASTLFDSVVVALHRDPEKTAKPVNTPKTHARQFRGKRVLLVEDNEVNRELAEEMLNAVGLTVELAENGAEAVERIQQGNYDLVLMDCQMPVMDGYEATRQIRAKVENRQLPIIAMTANAQPSDRAYCLAAGMNDHIPKPIDVSILYNTVAHWLDAQPPLAKTETTDNLTGQGDLDTDAALARLGGNRKMLGRLFLRFQENQGDVIARLNSARDRNDKTSMILDAHTLRGLAGNIGANRLAQLAGKLEDNLKLGAAPDSEAAGAILTAVEHALWSVLAILENAIPETTTPREAPILGSSGIEALSELQALLHNDDATAGRHFEALSGWLRLEADAALVEQLARQIGRYEFEEAMVTLQQIRSALINRPET